MAPVREEARTELRFAHEVTDGDVDERAVKRAHAAWEEGGCPGSPVEGPGVSSCASSC